MFLVYISISGDRNTWLLGDSGYPQEPWLMTPMVNAAPGTPQYVYTEAHVRARNCVERCIGVLKGRFRCLLLERKLRYSPEKVGNIINACTILHNICNEGNVGFEIAPAQNVDRIENPPNVQAHNVDRNNEGFIARENLINRYFR